MRMRLIIDIPEDIDVKHALSCVAHVIGQGKISEAGGIPHYCWVTTWSVPSIEVHTRRKRTKDSADSFWLTK